MRRGLLVDQSTTQPFLVSSRNTPPHKRQPAPQAFLGEIVFLPLKTPAGEDTQTAAANRNTFLSLCVCGLTNKPIMYKKFDNT